MNQFTLLELSKPTEEVDVFARQVTVQIKPGSQASYTQTMEKEIIPLLRKQHGFKDELSFVSGSKVVAISLWDQKDQAEAYDRLMYPQVVKALASVVEGTPHVEPFEVSNSTWLKIAA